MSERTMAGAVWKTFKNDVNIRRRLPEDAMEDADFMQRKTEFRVCRGSFCVKVFTDPEEAESYARKLADKR